MLDDSVLEAVEADDGESSARGEQLYRLMYQLFERLKFVVDCDPERLECPRRRMKLPSPIVRWHCAHDDIGELDSM
jgi:hypothetical protein